MLGKKTVWGLDIGKTAIKAVNLTKSGKGAKILDFVSVPIETNDEGTYNSDAVISALDTFYNDRKIGKSEVVVSLPGSDVFNKVCQIPPVKGAAQIKKIVEVEAATVVPFPMDEVSWGYHLLPQKEDDDQQPVGIFASKIEKVDALYDLLGAHRQTIGAIQMHPLALYDLIHFDQDLGDEVSVVIDVGEDSTEFLVMGGGHFFSRTLRVGGASLTKALKEKFKIPHLMAKDLKEKLGHNKQANKIFGILKPALQTIADEVKRSMSFYRSQAKNVNYKDVYVFGETSKLPGFQTVLERHLNLKLKTITVPDKIEVDEAIDQSIVPGYLRSHAGALGLAIQGLGLGQFEINFQSESEKQGDRQKSIKLFSSLSVAVILIAFVLSYQMLGDIASQSESSYALIKESLCRYDLQSKVQKSMVDDVKSTDKLLSAFAGAIEERSNLVKVNDLIARKIQENNLKYMDNLKKEAVADEEKYDRVWLRELKIDKSEALSWELYGKEEKINKKKTDFSLDKISEEKFKFATDFKGDLEGDKKYELFAIVNKRTEDKIFCYVVSQKTTTRNLKINYYKARQIKKTAWKCFLKIDVLAPNNIKEITGGVKDIRDRSIKNIFQSLYDQGIVRPSNGQDDIATLIEDSQVVTRKDITGWERDAENKELKWHMVTGTKEVVNINFEFMVQP